MKALIVHAHYEPKSFSAALKDTAISTLEDAGHEVIVSDLHAMNWNSVATAEDFQIRKHPDYCTYALEQRHAYENGSIAPDIAAEIEKVKWCDLLILNFPVFWFSAPAILKGWIDRVFVSGLFYGGKRFYDQGGMAGKRALVVLTLGGREHMFGDDAIHGDLETMFRPLLRGTLGYSGFEVLKPFVGYHVPYISHEARTEILNAYQVQLRGLDSRSVLRFPRLEAFDSTMRPLEAFKSA
jgi:NAD(P)H dehydrogenase (quinone)